MSYRPTIKPDSGIPDSARFCPGIPGFRVPGGSGVPAGGVPGFPIYVLGCESHIHSISTTFVVVPLSALSSIVFNSTISILFPVKENELFLKKDKNIIYNIIEHLCNILALMK